MKSQVSVVFLFMLMELAHVCEQIRDLFEDVFQFESGKCLVLQLLVDCIAVLVKTPSSLGFI